ncbi:hypothetical protein TKK_0010542 [Trichogramma kaykai]
MESREDTVRIKEERKDFWPDAGDDNNLDWMESYKIKNVETLPLNESSGDVALQVIDFECKNVKPEFKSLSTTFCETEYQSYSSVVKVEDQQQNNYSNEQEFRS